MQIHDTAFIAPGAVVLGDVTIGENSGIWYNAVVRGDRDSIVIGRESNIQDNAVVHLGSGYTVEIGDHVTIGLATSPRSSIIGTYRNLPIA